MGIANLIFNKIKAQDINLLLPNDANYCYKFKPLPEVPFTEDWVALMEEKQAENENKSNLHQFSGVKMFGVPHETSSCRIQDEFEVTTFMYGKFDSQENHFGENKTEKIEEFILSEVGATPEELKNVYDTAFRDLKTQNRFVEYMIDIEPDTNVLSNSFLVKSCKNSSKNILNTLRNDIAGVTVPFYYVGKAFSPFLWHVEDSYLGSASVLLTGAPKIWFLLPEKSIQAFEKYARRLGLSDEQRNFISPEELLEFTDVYYTIQSPQEMVITFPGAYHCGFSVGLNYSSAINWATISTLKNIIEAEDIFIDQEVGGPLISSISLAKFACDSLKVEDYSKDSLQNLYNSVEKVERMIQSSKEGFSQDFGNIFYEKKCDFFYCCQADCNLQVDFFCLHCKNCRTERMFCNVHCFYSKNYKCKNCNNVAVWSQKSKNLFGKSKRIIQEALNQ